MATDVTEEEDLRSVGYLLVRVFCQSTGISNLSISSLLIVSIFRDLFQNFLSRGSRCFNLDSFCSIFLVRGNFYFNTATGIFLLSGVVFSQSTVRGPTQN